MKFLIVKKAFKGMNRMILTTEEELKNHFVIVKDLSPLQKKKTFLVMENYFMEKPSVFVLKEVSFKSALVYEQMRYQWNPYIAEIYNVYEVPGTDISECERYYVLTEYVYTNNSPFEESLSLRQYININGPLDLDVALSITSQLCDALIDFHKQGFVHRDIKPENIILSEYDLQSPKIKLIDFGGAKEDKPSQNVDTVVIGTLGYQAPESLAEKTTKRSDTYSIGCILQFMLTGYDPGLSEYNKKREIIHIIEKATNTDPSFRYSTVKKLKAELEHATKLRFFDKIPLIREIPGYRTHNFMHSLVASFFYLCYIASTYGLLSARLYIFWLIISIFMVFIPLVFLFDLGSLIELLPKSLRRNNLLFILIRYFSVIYLGFILYFLYGIKFMTG